jgi:peptide/nickel transport system substrate-binding protein
MARGSYWTTRLTRRRTLGTGAAGLTALALAACGGSNNKNANSNVANSSNAPSAAASAAATSGATNGATPSGSPRAGTPAAAAASAASAPGYDSKLKSGGTIQYWFLGDAPLDPYENATYRAQYVAGCSYSRLFKFNSGADVNTTLSRQPVPDLATGYEITPDGITYTIKLQANAMFHPPLNRALTSADVVASWQRFTTDTKNTNGAIYAPIVDSISAPDATTVVYKLKQPYVPFLNKLANPSYFYVMSQDAVAGKIDPAQVLSGTGPWMLDSHSATAFTFKKNPNYFVKGLPYADGMIFNIIPDTSTQEAQFQAGALDLLTPPTSDVASLQKAIPKANISQYTANGLEFIFFADVTQDAVFKDPRMRQAASLALDRNGLIDLIYNGKGSWMNLINPGMGKWWLDPQGTDIGDAGQWFKHDPQKAKQLIQAAGQSNTQIKYIYANNAYGDVFNQAADAVRGMLSDAGFQLSVVTVDYLKDYINNGQGIFFKGAPSASLVFAAQTPFTDPDDYLSGMLGAGNARNNSKVNDPDLTKVIQQQQVETDENKRQKLVWQAQQMQDNQMYYVPFVAGKTSQMSQPWVQNWFIADSYGFGTESLMYVSLNK